MIRLATAADFEYVYGLYMHPSINPFLLYEQKTTDEFGPIFDDLIAQKIIYIYQDSGNDIGMFKLVPLAHRTSHISYLGGVAIHADYMGKGYGTKMLKAIIDFGATLALKRMELSTATVNLTAIALYEKVGFEKEGVLRRYTYLASEDRYLDEVMMSYLY